MTTIRLVAAAAFKESVRDRVPYSMVVFATLLIGASYLIAQITAGQDLKIIKDLGLAALLLFGMLIAVFIGVGLVSKEVERKSVFGVITKPVTRAQFIIGKFLGLVFTLMVNIAVMTVALYAMLLYMNWATEPQFKQAWETPALDPRLLIAVVLIIAEVMLVTAVAIFFASFSSPLLAALFTLGLWVAGHFNSDLRQFERVIDVPAAAWLARALYYLIPNLAPFDVKAEVVHGMHVSLQTVGYTLLYAALYIGLLLSAAIAIFRRRDFK